MRLNIVKYNNAQQSYVIESYRSDNVNNTSRIIEKLGSYQKLKKFHDDPVAWVKAYVKQLNKINYFFNFIKPTFRSKTINIYKLMC